MRLVKAWFFCINKADVENTYFYHEHEHKEVSRVEEAVVSDPSSVITVRRKTAGWIVFVEPPDVGYSRWFCDDSSEMYPALTMHCWNRLLQHPQSLLGKEVVDSGCMFSPQLAKHQCFV